MELGAQIVRAAGEDALPFWAVGVATLPQIMTNGLVEMPVEPDVPSRLEVEKVWFPAVAGVVTLATEVPAPYVIVR
jgi:hypothetical protein